MQVIQIFESWAHHMSPAQFEKYSKPYAEIVTSIIKKKYPNVPVIFFANGGSSYLEKQKDMTADMICIDWKVVVVAVVVVKYSQYLSMIIQYIEYI